MTALLSGELRLRPAAGGEGLRLGLTAAIPVESGDAVAARLVREGEAQEAVLRLEPTAFALSLVLRPAAVTFSVEGELVARQTVIPVEEDGWVRLGPVVLSPEAFDDRAGAVGLEVTVANGFDVAATLFAERFSLQLADTKEGQRLARMLQKVLAATPKLLPRMADTGLTGASSEKAPATAAFWRRVEEVASAYTELHRFFEKSARFRLQQGERMTTLARVSSVTHRTLEFIATHPEELIATEAATGIVFHGRHWLPVRTVDETHQRTFDIYENRCLLAFLLTVQEAAQKVLKTMDEIAALDRSDVFLSAVAPLGVEKQGLIAQLQGLAAAYARFWSLEDATPLTGLPEPSPIFISSAPYRRIYELMQAWFAAPQADCADVRSLLAVSKSSRIYEHYVLALLVEALGEPAVCRRIVWSGAPQRLQQSAACNEFVFRRADREITLFYEPLIASGVKPEASVTGLVRTMTFDFSPQGEAWVDPAVACWTPDYVIRVRDDRGTRCWIADAKYQTWPSFLAHHAQETLVKYLLATAPLDPREQLAGLVVFCGKSYSKDCGWRSFRNVDAAAGRTPAAEILTLCGNEKEAGILADWVENL